MEPQRREHERLPPQAGSRRVDPSLKQEVLERSAGQLEVLAVKEEQEMTGGESRLAMVDGVVNISSDDSDPDSDSDYESDDEELLVLGNKRSSMREGSNQEKLTGKKRTADMLQQDSREPGNKKISTICRFTIRSQPHKICEAVALLNEPQREKVKELGFGSLLDFRMDIRTPFYFIIWLMEHLETDDQDPDIMVLHFGGNRKLYITQDTVNSVLGLQKGKLDPPLMPTNTQKLNGLPSLRNILNVPVGKLVEVDELLKQIKSGGTDMFTMQCFMMVVFCKLIACNGSKFVTKQAWGMVNDDFHKFGEMNWCKFIVDQIKYSADMWKKPGGKKKLVYGCPAFLVMYYLDNLDCEYKMRCVEVPRAKFFNKEIIQNLVKADMLLDKDGLPTFGKLTLRNQRGTCYDTRAESSKHVTTYMPIPGTSDTDIVGTFCNPHDQIQIGDLSSHQSLSSSNKNNAKQQQKQLHITQIGEPQERRDENEDGLNGYDKQQTMACDSSELFVHQETDGDIVMATQGTTPPKEASDEFHDVPKISAVPQGEHEVTGGSEDGYRDILVHSVQGAAEDVMQLASTSTKEQVNDFMGVSVETEILQKLDSILPQIRASVALGVRASELEQQVQELTKKLSNTEEELEATREKLREAQSTIANNEVVLEGTRAKLRTEKVLQLEAQSAVAAINCLALRLRTTFIRLGSDPPSPSGMVSRSSLEEAVKVLENLVSLIEQMSRNYATSLARSSVGFVAAALLSRDGEKGVKALHDAIGADTKRLLLSQGPEFHSLVAKVVDAVQKQQHGNNAVKTR